MPVSTKRRVIAGVAVITVLVVGLAALGVIGAPAVEDVNNSFGEVNDEETVIETDLIIDNPNPIGVAVGGASVNYSVTMNEVHMATGGLDGIAIDRGQSPVPLNSSMENEGITDWWLSHVEADETTDVAIDATLTTERFDRDVDYTHTTTVDTDILSGFESEEPRELNADHVLVDDPILIVEETDATWGEVTATETPIEKEFLLYNPNQEPYVITEMGYEISMNEVSVGEGETDRTLIIEGHSHETLGLETAIDATTLDEWWVTHLDEERQGHQVSELRIDFWAVIELPDGQQIELDLDALTYEDYIGTDIFDEGGDVGVTPDEVDDRNDSDDGDEATDDDREADDGNDTTTDDDQANDSGDDDSDDADDETTDDDSTDEDADDDGGLLDDDQL